MFDKSCSKNQMWAAVYRGKQKTVLERIPVPKIKTGEVLVKVEACGVCATDLKKVEYGLVEPPRVFGHEIAGIIQKIGAGVRRWKIGDRVAVFHHVACKKCFYCQRKEYAQCSLYKKTGTTAGFEPAGGGFAQYLRVMPWIVRDGMIRIPLKNSYDEASFLEPVTTCLKGIERMGIRQKDFVLVFGQGPIGLIMTQLVRIYRGQVVGLDFILNRRNLSKKLGASFCLDPKTPLWISRIKRWTQGRGADAAILTVPSEKAFQDAMNLVRPGGRVLLFAHTKKGDPVTFDAGIVCVDEKIVLGSYSSSMDLFRKAASLVFTRKLKVNSLITHRLSLQKIKTAFELATNPTSFSLKVIIKP